MHRNKLPPVDMTVVQGIPVTTPARTLIDLASVAPRDAVEEALDDALRRGLVSMPRMRWRVEELAGGGGRPGILVMRALLDEREGHSITHSPLETRVRRLLKRAGLPDPVPQHPVRDAGRVVAVVDFAYPDTMLAIEADGYEWHSGRAPWRRDRARLNGLTLLGWRVIHVTADDLARAPETIAGAIRTALAKRATVTGSRSQFGPRRPRAR